MGMGDKKERYTPPVYLAECDVTKVRWNRTLLRSCPEPNVKAQFYHKIFDEQNNLIGVDTTVCMGASVSGLHGMLKAKPELSDKAVAVIGDSTFIHSGITGLIDIVYNRSNATVIILDNRITGMTGHQNNPANGFDIHGNEAPAIDLEQLCRAVGVKRVVMCDPYDLVESEKVIKQELAAAEPSVIIMRRPCALLKNVEKRKPLTVDADKCKGCKKCTGLGCPAISFSDKKAAIDLFSCVGCGICADVCSFGAIERGDK